MTNYLSEEKYREFTQAFHVFDHNGSGTISKKELSRAMRDLGFPVDKSFLRQYVDAADYDGDGKLDLDEFILITARIDLIVNHLTEELIDEYSDAFNAFDKNGDGSISRKEVGSLLQSFGERFSNNELREMIEEVDIDGDGRLDFEEFLFLMAKHSEP